MGMDVVGRSGAVHLNWAAWRELRVMLQANGFIGVIYRGATTVRC